MTPIPALTFRRTRGRVGGWSLPDFDHRQYPRFVIACRAARLSERMTSALASSMRLPLAFPGADFDVYLTFHGWRVDVFNRGYGLDRICTRAHKRLRAAVEAAIREGRSRVAERRSA